MNNLSSKNTRGITLVEVLIFTALLSLLISGSINYLYTVHISNMKLIDEIHDQQNK